MLTRHGKPYLALDSDADLTARCKREGYNAVFANAGRLECSNGLAWAARRRHPDHGEPVLAQHITRKLRAAYPDLPIIAVRAIPPMRQRCTRRREYTPCRRPWKARCTFRSGAGGLGVPWDR